MLKRSFTILWPTVTHSDPQWSALVFVVQLSYASFQHRRRYRISSHWRAFRSLFFKPWEKAVSFTKTFTNSLYIQKFFFTWCCKARAVFKTGSPRMNNFGPIGSGLSRNARQTYHHRLNTVESFSNSSQIKLHANPWPLASVCTSYLFLWSPGQAVGALTAPSSRKNKRGKSTLGRGTVFDAVRTFAIHPPNLPT